MLDTRIACIVLVASAAWSQPARAQCETVSFQHYDGAGVVPLRDPSFNPGEEFGIVVDGLPAEHFPIEVTRVGFAQGGVAPISVSVRVFATWPPPAFNPASTYTHAGVTATPGINVVDVTPSGPMLLAAQPFTVTVLNTSAIQILAGATDGNGCAGGSGTSIFHYQFVPGPGWFSVCPGYADWVFWIEYRPAVCSGTFCDGSDGALAACPCANPGDPDAGCDIAQGTGGIDLAFVRQETSPLNRATLSSSGYPTTGNPTTVLLRAPALDPSSPVVFGDGLRCVAVPLVRLDATFASNGNAQHLFGHGTMSGAGPFYYQLWLRNNPAMYCTVESFNLSSGRSLTW